MSHPRHIYASSLSRRDRSWGRPRRRRFAGARAFVLALVLAAVAAGVGTAVAHTLG
jgi:hypothetical protein